MDEEMPIKYELTGKICFKPALLGGVIPLGGLILYVQEEVIADPFNFKQWRKGTTEDISELEIHSIISEV